MQLDIDMADRPLCRHCGRPIYDRAPQARYHPACRDAARALRRYGPPKYPQLRDEAWLRSKYVDQKLTVRQIAAELGCSKGAITTALKRANIKPRYPGAKISVRRRIDEDAVVALYLKGDSAPMIAQKFQVGNWVIYEILRERGVVRDRSESGTIRWGRPEEREKRAAIAASRRKHTGRRTRLPALADDESCFFCGQTELLERHHINGVRSDNSKKNLLSLCPACHAGVEWLIRKAKE